MRSLNTSAEPQADVLHATLHCCRNLNKTSPNQVLIVDCTEINMKYNSLWIVNLHYM